MTTLGNMKKLGIALFAACVLAIGGTLVAAPAQAHADSLEAASGSQLVSTQGFRTVSTPKAPKIDACLASGAGKLSVHASVVNSAQGYEFQVSTNKKFTKNVKKKKVKAYGTTFSGLAKGKKYYVRVRAYQTATNLCTKWSPKKSTKTGIAYKKSKVTGTWKLVSTSSSTYNVNISLYKSYNMYIKMTCSKSGKSYMTGFNGQRMQTAPWVATGKASGYEYSNYKKGGSLKVSGSTLVYKYQGVTYNFKRA